MGKLYGIGVGPGDPELLTLKAYRILKEADIIFCPEKEAGAGSFAFDIIKDLLKDTKARIVNLVYPMHYHGGKLRRMWEDNAGRIAGMLKEDRTGAFITLGDPAVYSTFMYTLPYIERAGVEVEVVPGITSFCAVADSMKMPLVAWDEDLVVAPVVLMKPSSDQEALIQAIHENHLEDHFVLITKSGAGEERLVTDFEELKQYDIPYLSTIIIKRQGRQTHDCV